MLEVAADTVVVHEAAASHIQRLTKVTSPLVNDKAVRHAVC